jgi:hypothetical protein
MNSSRRAQWARCLPKLSKARASLLLTALLSLVILGVTPRSAAALRPQGSRCRDSRRPKPPRHILPSSGYKNSETATRSRRLPPPWAKPSGAQVCGGRYPSCRSELISARITSELTKPEYLKLFAGSLRQTSPPA